MYIYIYKEVFGFLWSLYLNFGGLTIFHLIINLFIS